MSPNVSGDHFDLRLRLWAAGVFSLRLRFGLRGERGIACSCLIVQLGGVPLPSASLDDHVAWGVIVPACREPLDPLTCST